MPDVEVSISDGFDACLYCVGEDGILRRWNKDNGWEEVPSDELSFRISLEEE